MAQAKKNAFSDFFKSHVEVVQGRISEFQKEADKLAAELSARGQAQMKELEKLVHKFESSQLADKSAEIVDRAKEVGDDFVGYFNDLHGKLAEFTGVATREQVSDIARELKNLSKKIDGLTKGAKSSRARS